jgi:hypothetical protein
MEWQKPNLGFKEQKKIIKSKVKEGSTFAGKDIIRHLALLILFKQSTVSDGLVQEV